MPRIGVIIPDRGDRPEMLKNCLRMIKGQTLQAFIVEAMSDPPRNSDCDITYRYRTAYDHLRNKNLDVIAFMENDDWYHPEYLETMFNYWELNGRPNLLGLNHTIYYHIKKRAYFTMYHDTRSCAMNTLIKPDLNFNWCQDHNPYTDIHLWHATPELKGIIVNPEKEICLGIKHGIGQTGGKMHTSQLHRYTNNDWDQSFLRAVTKDDPEGFNFYSGVFQEFR